MSKPYNPKPPYDGKRLLPMDEVILKDGRKVAVNSSHYIADDGVQKFTVCGERENLYRADEVIFLHRCNFEQYKESDQYICECGNVYTTMADIMLAEKVIKS